MEHQWPSFNGARARSVAKCTCGGIPELKPHKEGGQKSEAESCSVHFMDWSHDVRAQVAVYFFSRMRKKTASGVLASLRGSPYGPGKRLFIQAMGGRVKTEYDSPLRSLRPCWTAFLRILHGGSASSYTSKPVMATVVRMSFSAAC